jgi:hypothetical protein
MNVVTGRIVEAEMFWRFLFGPRAVVLRRHRRMYPRGRTYLFHR